MNNLLAQDQTINLKPAAGSGFTSLGSLTVPSIISGLIRLTVVVAAIVFFFILVIGGIRWIASGGDKAQTEAARNQITAALVGLVIVFAAWAIVQLINVFFHVDIFTLALPSVAQ
jgi:TRAP-type C4-dicarboxylate transport system permease small subunit